MVVGIFEGDGEITSSVGRGWVQGVNPTRFLGEGVAAAGSCELSRDG